MSEAEGTRKQLSIRIDLVFKANLLESGIWTCKWYTEHERCKCPKSSKHARTTGKWITAKTMLENTCHESLLTKCSSVHKGCGLHYAFMHAKSRDFSTTFYNDVKQRWWKRVTKTKALQFMGKSCAGRYAIYADTVLRCMLHSILPDCVTYCIIDNTTCRSRFVWQSPTTLFGESKHCTTQQFYLVIQDCIQ